MALLNKDQILDADDKQVEDVAVPEWGGHVRIRGLSGVEVDKYEQGILRGKSKSEVNIENATARLVAWCAIGEDGSRLFVGEADLKELGRKSAAALARCFEVASRLSGMRPGDVEKMVEDFDSPPSESSTSD
ncbi:hypothetical protein [Streptomyces sp. NPDC002855]|uniref:hypothetical protein n=1 Tax=Streptomyces sp. NPDC002855 TaxID=3154437 RepID=UPI00331A2723